MCIECVPEKYAKNIIFVKGVFNIQHSANWKRKKIHFVCAVAVLYSRCILVYKTKPNYEQNKKMFHENLLDFLLTISLLCRIFCKIFIEQLFIANTIYTVSTQKHSIYTLDISIWFKLNKNPLNKKLIIMNRNIVTHITHWIFF